MTAKVSKKNSFSTLSYQVLWLGSGIRLPRTIPLGPNNEKIFYPPTAVNYGSDCIEGDCPAGTLALFSPWGNVVMYYGPDSRYSGLYILGKAIEGADNIRNLSGTIRVEVVGGTSGIHSIKNNHTVNKSQEYALNGIIATEGQKGVLIKDGKKILVK